MVTRLSERVQYQAKQQFHLEKKVAQLQADADLSIISGQHQLFPAEPDAVCNLSWKTWACSWG